MEQENKMTIEEATVNLGCVKKELEEELEFAENPYKVASTYENTFGDTSEQRNNLNSLIGFLHDDIVMETKTGTIKLEDVKEENENVIRRNIEEFHFERIQCECCKVWLEKDKHLESHMLHCLENCNRLSHNLPGFRPTNTSEEDKVRGSDEISPSIHVDASYSIPSTEIIDSKRSSGIDCRTHRKDHISEKEYKCSECSYQTDFKSNLEQHLYTHNDIKPFECDICKKGFTLKGNLKRHIRNQHSNTSEKEYKRSECSYQTDFKSNLKQHLNTHNDIKPFECDICKKGFTRNDYLKVHIRNVHSNTSEKEYKRPECSYQTDFKSNLKQHLYTHHDIKPFECDICKKGFTRNDYLKIHIRNVHSNTSEKEYKCSECSYQTDFKSNLKQHLNTHNDINPFECDICKNRFSHKSTLQQHVYSKHPNTHNNIKLFECDICKKRFIRKYILKLHIRNHHSNISEKEYKCSECLYQTNRKDNLKQHLNTHNDIKPFECDICKEGFNYKTGLKLHIRNHHSNISEKEYKCSECLYQTNLKDNLKRHHNTHNNNTNPFECDICKKRFIRKGNLKRHIRNHHSNSTE